MFVGYSSFRRGKTYVVFLWHDPKMTPREKVVINQLRWEKEAAPNED